MSKYQIGLESFPSQAAIKIRCQSLLSVYHDSKQLICKGNPDYDFLLALLSRHPHADIKIGLGAYCFEVRVNPVYKKNLIFYVHRLDGSTEDFSYLHCIKAPNHRHKVLSAMRHAVRPQIVDYRRTHLANTKVCALSGLCLNESNCHVDHYPLSFLEIAQSFLSSKDLTFEDVKLIDCEFGWSIRDPYLKLDWKVWHSQKATYRLLHSKAHLSLPRSKPLQ